MDGTYQLTCTGTELSALAADCTRARPSRALASGGPRAR
eukprot:SAG11_NODE_36130_length_263_cov_0.634146_2_plen_38_part_01